MSYVLSIEYAENVQAVVDGLKRYFSRRNIERSEDIKSEIYFSGNLVAVGMKNLRKDFFETPVEVSHNHARFLRDLGIECKVLEFGEYEELEGFLKKHNIKKT